MRRCFHFKSGFFPFFFWGGGGGGFFLSFCVKVKILLVTGFRFLFFLFGGEWELTSILGLNLK